MITVKVDKGLERFHNKFQIAVSNAVKQAIDETHEEVLATKRQMTRGIGELDGSIKKEMVSPYEGRVYGDDDRLLYLEHGTGIKGEFPGAMAKPTKTFVESGMNYWFQPVDGGFKIRFSQPPRPFFRTTAFNRRIKNVEIIREALSNIAKEA